MIQLVMEQLQPAVNKVVIVSGNPGYKKFGAEVIDDLIKNTGPAGGIYSALSHTDTHRIFIVSCDMPFINTHAIEYMVQNSAQSQITLPCLHEKIEPLFGVYSKECLVKWKELIQKGITKLQNIVTCFKLQKLCIDDNILFNDWLFVNINDMNDYKKAAKQE